MTTVCLTRGDVTDSWSLGGFDTGGNRGAQKEPYSRIDVIDTIKIHDNRMHFAGRVDGGSTFGIDLDDGSSNYEIYNNLCLNMGIKLREGFHRNVYNNILVNGAFNLHCTFEDSYDTIEKNIVVKGNPYSLAATDANRFKISEDVIDNNWFYDLGMKVNYPGFSSDLGYDEHSVNADPKFRDTSKNDYTVTNELLMEKIGFENFPMDQFGKPGCAYQAPVYEKTTPDGNTDILEREQWLGATISALDDAIMSSTGAGSLDGVYMENVPEDSQAAMFGLQTGDVIKGMNGEAVGRKAHFVPEYNGIETGTLVNMDLIRNQLSVELNFIKSSAMEELIIDDQDPAVKYSEGPWEYSAPGHNAGNGANCVNQTMKYINMSRVSDKESVAVEAEFKGSQIEFIGRKERNMGEYTITISDVDGKVVQTAVCSANNGGDMQDQSSIFKSDVFPEGEYTLTLKWKSGGYLIVDAFKVFTAEAADTVPVVISPVTVEDDGTRVTELTSDKELTVQVPVTNHDAKAINVEAAAVLSGNDGALQFEAMAVKNAEVTEGESRILELTFTTPEGSESKRLEIYVYDKNSSQIYAYPLTIDGAAIVAKEVTVFDAVEDEVQYTYTADSGVMTVAAKGFSAKCQAMIQVTDIEENVIALRQVTVSEGGQAKCACILPKEFSGKASIEIRDEKGTEKTAEAEIKAGESILDKSALQEAVDAAKPILNDEANLKKYTKASWMNFYNAYMIAWERLESNVGTQEDVTAKTNALTEAQNALALLAETKTFNPSSQNVGKLFGLYRNDGTADGGNRDGKTGDQWQVRGAQVDATVKGSYAEFKGNFTSFTIRGANKGDSADFKVVITEDATGKVISEDAITQSRNQANVAVELYSKAGLSGEPQTIRVYQNGPAGYYLELREISYTTVAEDAEQIPTLTGIEVTKLPDQTEYTQGFAGNISLLGGELTETYSDGSTNVIPMNSAMYRSGFDAAEAGNQTIVAEHGGFTAEFTVKVVKADEPEKTTYTVAVTGGKFADGTVEGEFDYNAKVIVKADVPAEGMKFAGWKIGDVIVSTEETYTFYASNDVVLEAIYVAEGEAVEQNAEALLTNVITEKRDDDKYNVRFVGQLVLPEGYTVKEAGLAWSSKEEPELAVGADGARVTQITRISNTNQFSVTIKGMPAGNFLRGKIFAKVADANGNVQDYIYSLEGKAVTVK